MLLRLDYRYRRRTVRRGKAEVVGAVYGAQSPGPGLPDRENKLLTAQGVPWGSDEPTILSLSCLHPLWLLNARRSAFEVGPR